MADRPDYAKELEKALQEPSRIRPAGPAGPPPGSRPDAPGSATFSTVMAGMAELHKRIAQVMTKAQELEGLLTGEATLSNQPSPPQVPEGAPVFNRLAAEMVKHGNELTLLERSLDHALGALR